MSKIEPGDKFPIEYGNGRKIDVVALTWKQQRELAAQEDHSFDSISEAYDALEARLRTCVPYMNEEQFAALLQKLNFRLIQEIIRNTNQQNALSEDEEKKSESQP